MARLNLFHGSQPSSSPSKCKQQDTSDKIQKEVWVEYKKMNKQSMTQLTINTGQQQSLTFQTLNIKL